MLRYLVTTLLGVILSSLGFAQHIDIPAAKRESINQLVRAQQKTKPELFGKGMVVNRDYWLRSETLLIMRVTGKAKQKDRRTYYFFDLDAPGEAKAQCTYDAAGLLIAEVWSPNKKWLTRRTPEGGYSTDESKFQPVTTPGSKAVILYVDTTLTSIAPWPQYADEPRP